MARPLKSDEDRRDFKFRVRANMAEKTLIEQNAANAGQEPSVYLRSLGTGHKPTRNVPTPEREALLRVNAELNKVGSNLNQIARALNRRHDGGELTTVSDKDIIDTIEAVRILTRHIMGILK